MPKERLVSSMSIAIAPSIATNSKHARPHGFLHPWDAGWESIAYFPIRGTSPILAPGPHTERTIPVGLAPNSELRAERRQPRLRANHEGAFDKPNSTLPRLDAIQGHWPLVSYAHHT